MLATSLACFQFLVSLLLFITFMVLISPNISKGSSTIVMIHFLNQKSLSPVGVSSPEDYLIFNSQRKVQLHNKATRKGASFAAFGARGGEEI